MSHIKSTLVRSTAAAAATVLVTVVGMAPALADHDHGNGASRDHHAADAKSAKDAKAAKDAKDAKAAKDTKDTKGADADRRQGPKQDKGNNGRGDERGNGHTPVTVCHVLGNGSYNLLTFDDNALQAHVNHGDLYPVPAAGCPADGEETVPGTTPESDDTTTGDDTAGDDTAGDDTIEQNDTPVEDGTVAGVEEFRTTTSTQPRDAQILGVEAVAGVSRTAPVTGPLAGILPQTGAGQLGLAAAAGLLLVGAGATMVARRRTQGA